MSSGLSISKFAFSDFIEYLFPFKSVPLYSIFSKLLVLDFLFLFLESTFIGDFFSVSKEKLFLP